MSESVFVDPQYFQKKAMLERAAEANKACDSASGSRSSIYFKKPLALIEDRIDFHNRMANNLHALKRSLPQEMSHQAEQALCDLICGATK